MSALRAVVLVEGNSDRIALRSAAERAGRDLAAEGVDVVAMGGVTNTRAFAERYGPHGLDVPLAGLYDAADEHKVRQGLAAAGLGEAHDTDSLAALGFYRCSADLEEELIRAVGVDGGVEAVIEVAGRGTVAAAARAHARPAWLDPRRRAPAVHGLPVRAQGAVRGAARPGAGTEPGPRTVGRRARPRLSHSRKARRIRTLIVRWQEYVPRHG